MKQQEEVLVVTCKCSQTIVQAGDPEIFRDLKSKRQLGELTQEQIQALNIAKSEYISNIFIIVEPQNTEQ